MNKKFISIHEILSKEQVKTSSLEVQGTEFNIELSSIRKDLGLTKLKAIGLEKQTAKIEKESALKEKVES